ncbi:uncharacterized protein PADG_08628 [Paracoccidioides brasiliensis Pb18]|uniref:Uncharacterized protein n=1 Tax=Paracoccidioides brasiliensis (strain Pb18) TaxID=502780 RepID=C1GMX7_PARBD|nr:uncharacterized protein PADG_08628 [Paracoccidioides brasiliensis Pb18]EEH44979.2 hypothetical protein PADG_08628 [Paracoccidioides brasiliensis Pb18]
MGTGEAKERKRTWGGLQHFLVRVSIHVEYEYGPISLGTFTNASVGTPNPQQGSDWQPSVSDGQLWSIIGALGDSDGSTPPSPSQGPSVSNDPVLIEVRVARPQKTLGAKA